ncbi:murein transglycosylase A [Sphingomonas cavernae]|uniref:peptidoglycan lytic exotransglycosylase n=1 Tax=Sphingomonas cavernae TaxID=2320861 RepID=A0A418WLN4_9SPHN|nr:murein transglycosylase A [Sphingomonas cavernae]RJF90927.1 hypothetical protein D3876_12215 [Sphingomonas cavernae]
MLRQRAGMVLAMLALGACATVPPPAAAPSSPPISSSAEPTQIKPPANANALGVSAGPAIATLAITPEQALRALAAFRISCPSLIRRTDASGLTRGDDWKAVCDAAPGWSNADAAGFFRAHFESVRVGDGKGFATGYFEPEILGARTPAPGFAVPVYKKPDDLVEADLSLFGDRLKGKRIRGRVEKGALVPYHDRGAIEDGALAGRGLEIAWAADPVEFFFLQIQGSGRLKLPDGGVMRIGYDGQNGRDYTGIGKLLLDRGELQRGKAGMQGIMDWLRANPEKGRAVMRENKSVVFFRELTGAGPLGALGLPVTPRATVATDPAFVPLGAPVFLALDRAETAGIWVAQDTGGAIKGANRFDTFWGAGADARTIAGGMSARGDALIFLPRGTLARIAGAGDDGGTTPRR